MKEQLEEIINKAYKTKTEANYWNQIIKLREIVTDEMVSKCLQLIDSDDPRYIKIGIDTLCQLGENRKGFVKELFKKIYHILEATEHESLIYSCLFAIAHNNHNLKDKDVKALEKFQYSNSKNIRSALTHSLLGLENKRAITMLIKLAQDRSPAVRDWATFGLGTQIKTDTEEIRRILYKNCFSKDEQTRSEAIQGLANRKDERVKDIMIKEIGKGNSDTLLFDIIPEMDDAAFFLPELSKVYAQYKNDKNIDELWLKELKNCIETIMIS